MSSLSMMSSARPQNPDGLALEAWGQGFMVGSLLVMLAITGSNMRKGVLLHKLIVIELILALGHGTFIFLHEPAYAWYLSATAVGLNISWSLHNVVAWMKIRPFLSRWADRIYLGSLLLAQPYWVVEIYANFAFYNAHDLLFLKTRPLEPLFREPWWLFTACFLIYAIARGYNYSLCKLVRISPRFGIMIGCMVLSIIFIVIDTCAIFGVISMGLPTGIGPFWKLSFVFKCLSDTVILDDFKSALDRIRQHNFPEAVIALAHPEPNTRSHASVTVGNLTELSTLPPIHVTQEFGVTFAPKHQA